MSSVHPFFFVILLVAINEISISNAQEKPENILNIVETCQSTVDSISKVVDCALKKLGIEIVQDNEINYFHAKSEEVELKNFTKNPDDVIASQKRIFDRVDSHIRSMRFNSKYKYLTDKIHAVEFKYKYYMDYVNDDFGIDVTTNYANSVLSQSPTGIDNKLTRLHWAIHEPELQNWITFFRKSQEIYPKVIEAEIRGYLIITYAYDLKANSTNGGPRLYEIMYEEAKKNLIHRVYETYNIMTDSLKIEKEQDLNKMSEVLDSPIHYRTQISNRNESSNGGLLTLSERIVDVIESCNSTVKLPSEIVGCALDKLDVNRMIEDASNNSRKKTEEIFATSYELDRELEKLPMDGQTLEKYVNKKIGKGYRLLKWDKDEDVELKDQLWTINYYYKRYLKYFKSSMKYPEERIQDFVRAVLIGLDYGNYSLDLILSKIESLFDQTKICYERLSGYYFSKLIEAEIKGYLTIIYAFKVENKMENGKKVNSNIMLAKKELVSRVNEASKDLLKLLKTEHEFDEMEERENQEKRILLEKLRKQLELTNSVHKQSSTSNHGVQNRAIAAAIILCYFVHIFF